MMKLLMPLVGLLLLSTQNVKADLQISKCLPMAAEEAPLTRDAKILTSKAELDQYAAKYYSSPKRLRSRAYWDSKALSMVIPYADGNVKLKPSFVQTFSTFVETALSRNYIDAVIYQDMGHAHLLMPEGTWKELKKATADPVQRMEKVLESSELKLLFHTAEMLQVKVGDFVDGKFPQDPWLLWRYFSRNLVASFGVSPSIDVLWAGPAAKYNTVREIPGMVEVNTVYFSGSADACIPFVDKNVNRSLDITFEAIPYGAL